MIVYAGLWLLDSAEQVAVDTCDFKCSQCIQMLQFHNPTINPPGLDFRKKNIKVVHQGKEEIHELEIVQAREEKDWRKSRRS